MSHRNEIRTIGKKPAQTPSPTLALEHKPTPVAEPITEPTGDLLNRCIRLTSSHWEKLARIGHKLGPASPLTRSAVVRWLIDHHCE